MNKVWEKYEVEIPEEFNEMSEEMKRVKYPMPNGPEYVWADDLGMTDIKLNLLDLEASDDVTKPLATSIKGMLKSSNPNLKMESDFKFIDTYRKEIYGFVFTNQVSDGVAYTMMGYKQFGRYGIQIVMSGPVERKDDIAVFYEKVSKSIKKSVI